MDYVINIYVFENFIYQVPITKSKLKRILNYIREDGIEIYYGKSSEFSNVLDIFAINEKGDVWLIANGYL